MGIKVKTSYKGRRCKFPHCKHILSIYNHELFCHIHLGEVNCKQYLKKAKNNAT
ncbi:MAG: hypothetical protein ABH882_06285 [Candidatus Omnitrophota bacterium]|nr:hypothetical protein [Candidatus Omnitrophota bacterium]MBU2034568.1 hypothetical protein [Candidatus Omnitrophota bacterium]